VAVTDSMAATPQEWGLSFLSALGLSCAVSVALPRRRETGRGKPSVETQSCIQLASYAEQFVALLTVGELGRLLFVRLGFLAPLNSFCFGGRCRTFRPSGARAAFVFTAFAGSDCRPDRDQSDDDPCLSSIFGPQGSAVRREKQWGRCRTEADTAQDALRTKPKM